MKTIHPGHLEHRFCIFGCQILCITDLAIMPRQSKRFSSSGKNMFLSDPSPIIGYACHSLPNWLTNSRLVNLINVTLACEGNENFRQTRIYNFCVKCVVFARNRKFAKLTQWNMQYIPCNSALLAQETLFLTQKGTFFAQRSPKSA